MREIKFRAWDGNKMHGVCRLGLRGFSTDLWSPSPIACDSRYTDSLQIMQYTGLHDKNGKEIYEGDILLFLLTEKKEEVRFVEFLDGAFQFLNMQDSSDGLFWIELPDGEVIGNIYQQPDLLATKESL